FPAPVRPDTQAHRHIVSAHKTEQTDSGCTRCRQFWRVEARYGFMERPNVLAILDDCRTKAVEINCDDVTFYTGHRRSYRARVAEGSRVGRKPALQRWLATLFASQTS